jgi:hypothetical protein
MNFKKWLIMKIAGSTPIIMNVTLTVVGNVLGAERVGIFEKCNIHHYEDQED